MFGFFRKKRGLKRVSTVAFADGLGTQIVRVALETGRAIEEAGFPMAIADTDEFPGKTRLIINTEILFYLLYMTAGLASKHGGAKTRDALMDALLPAVATTMVEVSWTTLRQKPGTESVLTRLAGGLLSNFNDATAEYSKAASPERALAMLLSERICREVHDHNPYYVLIIAQMATIGLEEVAELVATSMQKT